VITPRQAIAGTALLAGAALVAVGLVRLVLHERRSRQGGPPATAAGTGTAPSTRSLPPAVLLLFITLAGAWLRIREIDLKTFTHTEGMLPNLPWPAFAWPPPRHSLWDTFWWHYHSELHPHAHYLLMWAWTNVFGTSLASLRLPSAIFGIASIVVAYRIGDVIHNRAVGLLAAAFIAFNGFHIFNSQYARVYLMVSFLALLSALALLHIVKGGPHRWRWEATYLVSAWLGLYTQAFFWLVLAVQMAWVAIQAGKPASFVRRVLGVQALVVMLGATALAHQIYQDPPTDYPATTPGFVIDYLLLGFAFLPDVLSIPQRTLPLPAYAAFAALAMLLVGVGCAARGRTAAGPEAEASTVTAEGTTPEPPSRELPGALLRTVAAGSALVTLGFVVLALQRRAEMAVSIAVPLLALGLPGAWSRMRTLLPRSTVARALRRPATALSRPAGLVILLAFLPTFLLAVLSLHASVLNERGFQVFASFLLILAAAGTWVVARNRVLRLPLALALIALHVLTIEHWRHYPIESRDYRALAVQMNARMQPGDLVFVVPRENAITPLYYYLDGRGYTYVPQEYGASVAGRPDARVWLVYFESYVWGPFRTTTGEMTDALAGFELAEQVEALRARAQLYRSATD
jgi:hypothetical protein